MPVIPAGERDDRSGPPRGGRLAVLCLTALGVVYGDIGTSPIYALKECFHGEYAIEVTRANVLGVLSLMIWSLLLVVSLKYLVFILRADNHGEGGIMALTALLQPRAVKEGTRRMLLVALGLFGASLLYGDGIITPSISVLSAVEGLGRATPAFDPFVIPITVSILVGLFLFQRRGTQRVGVIFGPVMLVWFTVLAVLGVRALVASPEVLAAASPLYAVRFLLTGGLRGYFVLGAVFLVVTGTEALYADMGHVGRRPIRLNWYGFVLPALLVNYLGQGALLLSDPAAARHPFYATVPPWALYPMILLASAATVIASQAVISGVFSLTRQAIQLGYCPRLRIQHTSAEEVGQIYVPAMNWILMAAAVALVIGFRSTSKLAAAYGLGVAMTMFITTILFYFVARERWGWSRLAAGVPTALFLVLDLSFLGANASKITHGAWFPLFVGGVAYFLLSTWKRGRLLLERSLRARGLRDETFLEQVKEQPPYGVPGLAVYMTSSQGLVPPAMIHNLKHNRVLHEKVVFLSVLTEEVPRVAAAERMTVEELAEGIYRVELRYGFMEDPNVPHALAVARGRGLDLDAEGTSFILGRERFIPRGERGMPAWREKIFAFLARNALGATTFFRIPPAKVIEIGQQIEL